MDPGHWWLVAAVAAVAGGMLPVVAFAAGARRARRRLEHQLAASRQELAAVQERLDRLSRRVGAATPAPGSSVPPARPEPQEFVITTAGLPEAAAAAPTLPERQLTAREFVSVALGESLVTVAALGHGVRRALSAENRNRIAFEMRREVRRARKQRKEDLKEAKRRLRANAFVTDATRTEDAA